MVEVELRFKADEKILSLIERIGKLESHSEELDKYYKFSEDKTRKVVIRVRYKDGKEILTFKGSSVLKEDSAWQEWENKISDSEDLIKLLLSNGFEELVVIKKLRKKFSYEDFEINFDNIEKLGCFVEIELKGDNPEVLRKRIIDFAKDNFNILEDALIKKGYVKLMLNE